MGVMMAKMAKKTKKKKRKKKSEYQKLFDQCWKAMSLFTRLKHANPKGFVKCITCGIEKPYGKMNAGHYFHKKLDFEEININPQCVRCNKHLSGNLAEYALYIMTNFGDTAFKELQEKAKAFTDYTEEGLRELLPKLEAKVEQVKNGEYVI